MFYLAAVDLAHAVSNTAVDGGFDINQIAQLSGGNPLMVVALGAVAAFGGKKGLDWLKSWREQKHEEKMAAIEAQKVSIPAGTGHEQCVAKQEALESQISAVKGKVSQIESKAAEAHKSFETTIHNANENFTTINEEVKKLKKKVKKIKEEIDEQEEEKSRKKSKKKRVADDDDD